MIVEEWTTCMTYLDPHLQSLFTKASEVYHTSKDSIRPHVVKARKMTDPYIQVTPHLVKLFYAVEKLEGIPSK